MALPSSFKRRLTITLPGTVLPPALVPTVPAVPTVTTAPAVPSMPTLAPASTTSVSGPTLPVPGHSGLGWVRDALPLPLVRPTAPAREGRGAVSPGRVAGRPTPGAFPYVTPTEEDANDPSTPTTAEPLHRFRIPIGDRHATMYPRLQDTGAFRPWMGKRFPMLDGRPGGVPQLPAPVNAGLNFPDPKGGWANQKKFKELRKTIAQVRRWQKPETILRPGIGGLDVAMGPRYKPGTPDGRKDLLRDVRLGRWRPSFADGTVPAKFINDLGRMRASQLKDATVPASTPVSTLDAIPSAPTGGGVVAPVMLPPGMTAPAPGPTTSDAPTPSGGPVLGIAAALALLSFLK